MINDVAADLTSTVDEDFKIGSSALSSSASSTTNTFCEKDKQQIIAETIVFSFLQNKEGKRYLKNSSLVPGIGISRKNVVSYFYDCEEDVLLGTTQMDLYAYKSFCYNTIVL